MVEHERKIVMDVETGEILPMSHGPVKDMSNEDLVRRYVTAIRCMKTYEDDSRQCAEEMRERMERESATMLPDYEFEVELVTTRTYDQEAFTVLKEMLTGIDLSKVLDEAYTETVQVPDKWHTSVLLPMLERYGGEFKAVKDRAQQIAGQRVKVSDKRTAGRATRGIGSTRVSGPKLG